MAFNGTGTFARIHSWVSDKANSIKILASRMDAEFDGIATGLSSVITKDGQTTCTARVPFAQGISLAGSSTQSAGATMAWSGTNTHTSSSTETYNSGSTVNFAVGSIVNLTASGGTTARTLASHLGDLANVKDYGAVLDGVTDDTAAWNLALASGRNIWFPEGDSFISGKVSFSATRGQRIVGTGNNASQFIVDTTFDLAATAVIEIGAIGQQIRHLGIVCEQPSTAVRANLVAYPWIIRADAMPSTEIHDVWISNSYNGVRLYGNCGQSVVDYLKIGGFNVDLHVDGSVDTVRIDHYHSWPLDFSGDANLMSIYSDGTRIAAEFGRVDDLDIGSLLSFEGRIRFGDLSGLGTPFGVAAQIGLDGTASRLEMGAGRMNVAACYGTGGELNDYKIAVSGTGALTIAALQIFLAGSTLPQAFVYVNGASAYLTIASMLVEFREDSTLVVCDNSGHLTITGAMFVQVDAIARAQPVIRVLSGEAVITGCTMRATGAGSGTFIDVSTDGYHVIAGNNFGGWLFGLPAQQASGCYEPNSGVPVPATGVIYHGTVRAKKFTGTLSGAGAATVAHVVTGGQSRVVTVQAFYIGGSGERVPMTVAYVDGSSIAISGGGASASYEVWLQYV